LQIVNFKKNIKSYNLQFTIDFTGEGEVIAGSDVRGKSELHRAVWFLTGTGSDPRESATENTPRNAATRRKGEKVR
jgi:hypothetical protein